MTYPATSYIDDEAFCALLAPYRDEHVRDRYWHTDCLALTHLMRSVSWVLRDLHQAAA